MKKGVHSCPVHKHLKKNSIHVLGKCGCTEFNESSSNTQLLISPISVLRRPLNNLTRFLCQLHVFDIQENSRAELELDRLTCMDG